MKYTAALSAVLLAINSTIKPQKIQQMIKYESIMEKRSLKIFSRFASIGPHVEFYEKLTRLISVKR